MTTYRLTVHREERWWIVDAPDVGYRTQARTLAEAEAMGIDLIASALDLDPDSVRVHVEVVPPAEVAVRLDAASQAEEAARKQAGVAAAQRRAAVAELHDEYGMSAPEVARVLHITRGRVYQLLSASKS